MKSIGSGCLALLQDLIGANSESEDEIVALDWICDYHVYDDTEDEHVDRDQRASLLYG
jgi:hypothetical protein